MQVQQTQPAGTRAFLIVWAGQLISLLGTGMTQFALSIWAWQLTGQATALALVIFFSFTPMVLFSPIAGALIDRWNRKFVLMISDLTALLSTTVLLLLYTSGSLQIWHLYAAAVFTGLFQAFQWPAYGAAISTMVPKEQYARANGMLGLTGSMSNIGSPILASILIGTIGIGGIMIIDVVTYLLAIGALLVVFIPQPTASASRQKANIWRESLFGFRYIFHRHGLLGLLLIFLMLNLVSTFALTVATPMILARSGNDRTVLGAVQSCLGVGGVVGGLVLSTWGGPRRRVHGIFLGMTFAMFGVLILGLGRGAAAWMAAGFFMALFVPFIDGSNQAIWQAKVEPEVQGRVFATRRLIAQMSTPLVMLLAGPLADHVFEPAMGAGGSLTGLFGPLVGTGPGAGMAVMFIVSGILGILVGLAGYAIPVVRDVERNMPDQTVTEKPQDESTRMAVASPIR